MPGKKKTQQKKFVKKGSKKQVNKKVNRKLSRKQYKKRRTIKKRGGEGDKEKHDNLKSTLMKYISDKLKENQELKVPESKFNDIKYQLNYHHRIQYGCTDEKGKTKELKEQSEECKPFVEERDKIKNAMAKYSDGLFSTVTNPFKSLSSRIHRKFLRNQVSEEHIHNKADFLIQFSYCMKLYKTEKYNNNQALQDKIDFFMYNYFVLETDKEKIKTTMTKVISHIHDAANEHSSDNNDNNFKEIVNNEDKKAQVFEHIHNKHDEYLTKKTDGSSDSSSEDDQEKKTIHENYENYCKEKEIKEENKLNDKEVEELINIYLHNKKGSNHVSGGEGGMLPYLAGYATSVALVIGAEAASGGLVTFFYIGAGVTFAITYFAGSMQE